MQRPAQQIGYTEEIDAALQQHDAPDQQVNFGQIQRFAPDPSGQPRRSGTRFQQNGGRGGQRARGRAQAAHDQPGQHGHAEAQDKLHGHGQAALSGNAGFQHQAVGHQHHEGEHGGLPRA